LPLLAVAVTVAAVVAVLPALGALRAAPVGTRVAICAACAWRAVAVTLAAGAGVAVTVTVLVGPAGGPGGGLAAGQGLRLSRLMRDSEAMAVGGAA
jgi:hypothetical protein